MMLIIKHVHSSNRLSTAKAYLARPAAPPGCQARALPGTGGLLPRGQALLTRQLSPAPKGGWRKTFEQTQPTRP